MTTSRPVTAAITICRDAVWLSVPDVPTNCAELVPAAVLDAAEKLTCCGVPGVRFTVPGEAVTPAGSPLMATWMGPVNPLSAVADKVADCVAPPVVRVTVVGLTAIAKSGADAAAVTFNWKDALWLRVPEVPTNWTEAVPVVAFAAAEKLICCGVPGVRLSVAGDAVTPVGSPLIVTWTVPVNPLRAVAESVTACAEPPALSDTVVGLTVRLKSGGGGAVVTLSCRDAVWLRVPEVPTTCTVTAPTMALGAAEKLTCCGVPGVRLTIDGEAVTPEGNPPIVTWMLPAKPLRAVADRLTV